MDLLSFSQSLVEKKISPKELVEQCLTTIRDKNPQYNALITVCEEDALAAATLAEEEINERGSERAFSWNSLLP